MARISLISRLVKTTLSYLFTGLACLAYALALQVLFEWVTIGLNWTTLATFVGATLLSAALYYLGRLPAIGGQATHPAKLKFKLKLAGAGLAVALPVVMAAYLSFAQVATGASQWQHLTLSDGSIVHLDARSSIKVDYSDTARIVRLYKGGAIFEVVPEPQRRFIVRTSSVDAVAVGTKFGVSLNSGVITTVSEGTVKVTRRGKVDDVPVSVTVNQELRVPDRPFQAPRLVQVDARNKLDWANGWLTFTDFTVAEGAKEFNRRNTVQIVVESPSLATIRFSGYFRFRVDSPENYAEMIADQTGATVTWDEQDGVIRLKE